MSRYFKAFLLLHEEGHRQCRLGQDQTRGDEDEYITLLSPPSHAHAQSITGTEQHRPAMGRIHNNTTGSSIFHKPL